MTTPECLSATDLAEKLPALAELVQAASVLFGNDPIEAVVARVRRSHEHTYTLEEA